MRKRKIRITIEDSDDIWTIIKKLGEELRKENPRRRFKKWTKLGTLADQNNLCNMCYVYLDFPEYDHIDGDRSNNSNENCQALCPNCHAKKSRTNKNKFW